MCVFARIDLERKPEHIPGIGVWKSVLTLQGWAEPADMDAFEHTLVELCDKHETDCGTEYSIDDQGTEWLARRMNMLHEDAPDEYCDGSCLPIPPARWEDTPVKITILR